jgi:solute carrier family 50 protein (sugar transporter)
MVAMWANCVAWLVYSFLTVDIYVLASNIPGLLLGSFMTISCYGYADEKVIYITRAPTCQLVT